MRPWLAVLTAPLVLGCQFDPSEIALVLDGALGDSAASVGGVTDGPEGPDAAATIDAVPPDAGPCATYGAPVSGSRYRVGVGTLSWSAAELDCEGDGGHLAIIGTQAENSLVAGVAGATAWIGLGDHQAEGTFVWVDGSALDFESWQAMQPNDEGGVEDCVEIKAGGIWNDTDCRTLNVWVCECDGVALPAERTWCDTRSDRDCGECGHKCPGASICRPDQTCS